MRRSELRWCSSSQDIQELSDGRCPFQHSRNRYKLLFLVDEIFTSNITSISSCHATKITSRSSSGESLKGDVSRVNCPWK